MQRIINFLFLKFPFLKEFCLLSLPFAISKDRNGLFNGRLWTEYLSKNNDATKLLPTDIDSISKNLIKRLIKRRIHIRYFLTLSEIIQYYRAKRLRIPYWFPSHSTMLKNVFLYNAGVNFIPMQHQSLLCERIAIDGGAASGDSSIALITSGAKQVLAFEPSPLQRSEMVKVFARNGFTAQIKTVPYAISDGRGALTFRDQHEKEFTVQSISIDEYCNNLDIGCIKLDIEGSEFPAIRGAVKTITRCRPILLICVYHRPEDLFELPRWIQQKFPFYQFRLRDTEPGNRSVGVHLMLIGWPTDRVYP